MRKNKVQNIQAEFSILTLDDDVIMTATLQSYFQSVGFRVDTENDPLLAIEKIKNERYDILLLDFLMRPIYGDEVVRRIRQFNSDLFIILLTGHKSMAPPIKTIRELDIQGYYEKSDRFDQLELLVESCVKSIRHLRTIRKQQQELHQAIQALRDGYLGTINTLREVVDAKDRYTRGHSDRVAYYASRIAQAMGKDEAYQEQLRLAGLFHDIGKVGIPDSILQKTGRLTPEEYRQVQEHSRKGSHLLSSIPAFQNLVPIIECHHERYDGTGYPNRYAGTDIPEAARILTIADAFDAMTTTRTYHQGIQLEPAAEEIRTGRGTQFDPDIADIFLALLPQLPPLDQIPSFHFDSLLKGVNLV